ncbi:MAG: dioxygenase [Chromatiales bacterium]|jgi:aromatic ring-opening dioxygenase catalytic subunit (LigB family)|nr:dioxygenase [Chromatiales bacterium]
MPKSIFISHGGGPLPLLGDPLHREMAACLTSIAAAIPKPDAIVVASAHWEAPVPTVTAAPSPALLYDYYGFPPESYEIRYPCPGSPALARQVHGMLADAGIDAALDGARGLDHGVFVPLTIMYPQADIPCVQLSLLDSLDPARHVAIGRALAGLGAGNVLLVGSGFSFHNLKAFFGPPSEAADRLNVAFEDWLGDVVGNPAYPEADRTGRLVHWDRAPGARFCHPREEHLLPLHVCYGAAGIPSLAQFRTSVMNKQASFFVW